MRAVICLRVDYVCWAVMSLAEIEPDGRFGGLLSGRSVVVAVVS